VKFVKVRLSGDTAALGAALALLVSAAQDGGAEIAEQSALYPNRCDPGCRVYLTLAETTEDHRGAAHRRQAIRRPAAPIPAKESQGKRRLP
jgi:hypothetical protein